MTAKQKQTRTSVPEVPAPWNLKGRGIMLLYKFSKDFALKHGFLSEEEKAHYAGGLGATMIVDYESSDCGPYGELLFIPGRLRSEKGTANIISKIYVSSESSVVNGRANWGIPKELADFNFERNNRSESVIVKRDGKSFFEASFSSGGLRFPVHTALIPFPLSQNLDGKRFHTRYSGRGWGRLARIESMHINAALFPDLTQARPLAVMTIEDFRITFPVARIEPITEGERIA
ncbi:acetoacetate decarboxylase family protein [Leptonema illini]|uniref:Acetoacetate decarboxylase n=1 Tax=Leptonema illini DSM 21528 TaxID=929563 RepID=H2CFV9_9LEPT|nr:acetoacetate decarboxylase family protein [Leptonema illini]EHQ06808.1 hypothetical protein Lepil_2130 [Leptonema illini DSM 21528]